MNRFRAVVTLLCSLLLLAACGGDPSSDDSSSATGSPSSPTAAATSAASSPSSPAPAAAGSSDDAFCTGWDKNGGTLATIGELPTFYPKESLVEYAEETLAVMKGLTPPRPISAAWTAYQQFQTRLLTAARSLDAGQRLSGPVPGRDKVKSDYTKINAWISQNC